MKNYFSIVAFQKTPVSLTIQSTFEAGTPWPLSGFLKFFTDGISQKIKKGTISLSPFLRPPLNKYRLLFTTNGHPFTRPLHTLVSLRTWVSVPVPNQTAVHTRLRQAPRPLLCVTAHLGARAQSNGCAYAPEAGPTPAPLRHCAPGCPCPIKRLCIRA